MYTSKQMDLDGNISEVDVLYEGKPIFRKYVSLSWGMNELIIAKKLFLSKLRHSVTIYQVVDTPTTKYIDMELLRIPTGISKDHEPNLFHDIFCALTELHQENIIYIDLKSDNIGYSDKDSCWKLFDFDCSGVCNDTFDSWLLKPPFFYGYKTAIKHYYNVDEPILSIVPESYTFSNFLDIDSVLYELFHDDPSM